MMITPEQRQALDVARGLVRSGVPVFLARPDDANPTGYKLPKVWDHFTAVPTALDAWEPGMAVVAVTGCGLDLVDIDPRSGGVVDAIMAAGVQPPEVYLTAETPSGGTHFFVKSIGVPSLDGVFPGIDLKAGAADGSGRGLAFLAPTVRRSKVDGVAREYRWVGDTSSVSLGTNNNSRFSADDSGASLRRYVADLRGSRGPVGTPRRVAQSAAAREFDTVWNRLVLDLKAWAASGWGGEAHAGLLAATTFLARIAPDHAEHAFREAFRAAELEPDAADLAKLESALETAVPDVVVPDDQMTPSERFLKGGDSPLGQPGTPVPAAAAYAINGRRRFQPMTRAEAANIKPPEPLIEGVLQRGTKARLSGASGAGKTWVILDMAAHVQNGMAWRGLPTKQGRVLYVAAEGAPSFDLRMSAWELQYGVGADVHLVPEAPQVLDETWAEMIGEIVTAGGYDLVIFDTQGAITVGTEENSNRDANVAQARLSDVIKATGAAVLLVHHTGWEEGDRPRGASAMYGGMDTELVLSRSGRSLTLKNPKQRYIEEHKPMTLGLVVSGGGLAVEPVRPEGASGSFFGGVERTETEVRVTELVERLTAYYAAGGRATATVRSLVQVLRVELNVKARNEVLRAAAQRYTAALGMPVELDDKAG